MFLDRWSREVQVAENTQHLREAAIKEFANWTNKPLEEINRRAAGDYVCHLLDRGLQPSSARAYLSKLSAYWKWLIVKGLIEPPNIWEGQTARGQSTPREPWSPAEICYLIQNAQSERLRDAILIAAHSGLRADECCQLKRGDCIGGLLTVSDGKTAASKRMVPQHSAIQKLVAERMRGKQPDDYLLHEYKGSGRQLSKDFSLLKAKLYGEAEGRQATKVFHSLRHFAKTAMLRGRARELAVNELLGHTERGMNRVYFHGVDPSELREAIELIKVHDE